MSTALLFSRDLVVKVREKFHMILEMQDLTQTTCFEGQSDRRLNLETEVQRLKMTYQGHVRKQQVGQHSEQPGWLGVRGACKETIAHYSLLPSLGPPMAIPSTSLKLSLSISKMGMMQLAL